MATSAAQMVIDAIEAGVRAIHSEKPMADTWGNAWWMAGMAAEKSVQLTFTSIWPAYMARDLLNAGEMVDLIRLEVACGDIYA